MLIDTLDLEINLSSTYWDKPPRAKVWLDNSVIFQGLVDSPIKIKTSLTLREGEHCIKIGLFDKDGKTQTIMADDRIVKDQLLNIDSIIMDDIDLGYLLHANSTFVDQSGQEYQQMVNLGLNGIWTMPFQTPIYVWLLENL